MSSPRHSSHAALVVCLLALMMAMMGYPQQSDGIAEVLTATSVRIVS